jgi:hypothetical protein
MPHELGTPGSRWNLDKVREIHQVQVSETEYGTYLLMWMDLCDRFHVRECKTKDEVEEQIYKLGERI